MTHDLPPATGPAHDGRTIDVPPEPQHRTAGQIFLRGLAITLPSILTLVIVLWLGRLVYDYIIAPVSTAVRYAAAQVVERDRPTAELVRYDRLPPLDEADRRLLVTAETRDRLERRRAEEVAGGRLRPDEPVPVDWLREDGFAGVYVPFQRRAVPYADFLSVAQEVPPARRPTTANGVYMELVTIRYFGSTFTLSALAVLITILAIYFVGRLVRIRLGAFLVHRVETDVLGRLPIISQVYGSVKQVTDFLFSEQKVQYNRVVALEYPRKGIWSIGFVTGEGMRQAADAAGEPLVNVLVPTSPMPVTGYTMSVPRSQVIDLDISFDQAFQFIVSCGVLVAPHQQGPSQTAEAIRREATRRLEAARAMPAAVE